MLVGREHWMLRGEVGNHSILGSENSLARKASGTQGDAPFALTHSGGKGETGGVLREWRVV